MNKFKISRKAEVDLVKIWDYTKFRWSKNQANKYLSLIFDGIKFISKNPSTGKPCNDIREDYFKFPIESHIVFYKQTSKKEIEVIRLLHKSADIESQF